MSKKTKNRKTSYPLPEGLVDEIASRAKTWKDTEKVAAVSIGRLVYEKIYRLNREMVQARRPIYTKAMNKLSHELLEKHNIRMTSNKLYQCMKVAIEPAHLRSRSSYKALDFGCWVQLARLTDTESKIALCDRCYANRWNTAKLTKEVNKLRSPEPKNKTSWAHFPIKLSDDRLAIVKLPTPFTGSDIDTIVGNLIQLYSIAQKAA